MSYARFDNDSDVYIFWDGNFMVCCGCKMSGDFNSVFLTPTGMIGHLKIHEDMGDKVPSDIIPAIEHDLFVGLLEKEA